VPQGEPCQWPDRALPDITGELLEELPATADAGWCSERWSYTPPPELAGDVQRSLRFEARDGSEVFDPLGGPLGDRLPDAPPQVGWVQAGHVCRPWAELSSITTQSRSSARRAPRRAWADTWRGGACSAGWLPGHEPLALVGSLPSYVTALDLEEVRFDSPLAGTTRVRCPGAVPDPARQDRDAAPVTRASATRRLLAPDHRPRGNQMRSRTITTAAVTAALITTLGAPAIAQAERMQLECTGGDLTGRAFERSNGYSWWDVADGTVYTTRSIEVTYDDEVVHSQEFGRKSGPAETCIAEHFGSTWTVELVRAGAR
jgi:hypothetical protein